MICLSDGRADINLVLSPNPKCSSAPIVLRADKSRRKKDGIENIVREDVEREQGRDKRNVSNIYSSRVKIGRAHV